MPKSRRCSICGRWGGEFSMCIGCQLDGFELARLYDESREYIEGGTTLLRDFPNPGDIKDGSDKEN